MVDDTFMAEIEDSRDELYGVYFGEDPRKLALIKASKKVKHAEIERVTSTIAHCPECDAEYDVDDFDKGDIDCDCGITFHWCSEI